MHILLVEDDEMVRSIFCAQLQSLGHDVLAAPDGSTALEELAREDAAFDLLMTDIRMPGAPDGWGLAKYARRMHPDLPVLYATAYSNEPYQPVPHSIVLKKPFTAGMLANSIAAICDGNGGFGAS